MLQSFGTSRKRNETVHLFRKGEPLDNVSCSFLDREAHITVALKWAVQAQSQPKHYDG